MNTFEKIAVGFLVLLVIGLGFLIYYSEERREKFHELCIQKNGYVLQGRNYNYCIDKNAIIEIKIDK